MIIKLDNKRDYSSLYLNEASRQELISKSRRGSKERYRKRLNYQVSNYRGVDLGKLFIEDYLVFQTPIGDYDVTIAFPGALTELRNVVKSTNGDINKINYKMVLKALRIALDKTDDVRVRCSCADFRFRYMYWANKYGYLYGPIDRKAAEFPEKTNPEDSIGATCKHLDLLLANKRWLIKAASVVNALVKAYPDKASKYLYDPEDLEIDIEEEEDTDLPQED